jgi:hypothetical protein
VPQDLLITASSGQFRPGSGLCLLDPAQVLHDRDAFHLGESKGGCRRTFSAQRPDYTQRKGTSDHRGRSSNGQFGSAQLGIIRNSISTIVEVPEEQIAEAVRMLFELANLKVEPTGALSVAAVMTVPVLFRKRSVCSVVSGGNVDPAVYAASTSTSEN